MLIREVQDAIDRAKKSGKLVLARHIVSWSPEPRVLLMCAPLVTSIIQGRQSKDQKERQGWAQLEAAFSHFIEGGLVTDDLIKQLRPPKYEHWELRSRKPRPSLRVFGRFALPDVFIATHVKLRKELGDMWSPEFEHQKLVCEDIWSDAGLAEPFSDRPDFQYEKYITENARKKLRVPK